MHKAETDLVYLRSQLEKAIQFSRKGEIGSAIGAIQRAIDAAERIDETFREIADDIAAIAAVTERNR